MSQLSKLHWRCRRGMREMDLLLGGFLEQHYLTASIEMQQSFTALLEEIDQDILDWIMQRQTPPAHYIDIINHLRDQQSQN